jgi:hypothetical protein
MNIFLAAPFTGMLEISGEKSTLAPAYRELLLQVIMRLEEIGHCVISSHRREQWGGDIYEPSRAVVMDFDGLRACDLVLALIGDPPSPGVQMELGYALAFEKKIIFIHSQNFKSLPHLVKGIEIFANVSRIEISSYTDILDIVTTHPEFATVE